MGTRNPRTSSFSDFAQGVETVNDMMVRRWRVRAYCPTCQKAFKVSLGLIATLKGPRYSLWDRRAPCKLYGCAGKVHFEAIPHRTQQVWTELCSPSRVGVLCKSERLNGRPMAPLEGEVTPNAIRREPANLDDDSHPCGWL